MKDEKNKMKILIGVCNVQKMVTKAQRCLGSVFISKFEYILPRIYPLNLCLCRGQAFQKCGSLVPNIVSCTHFDPGLD